MKSFKLLMYAALFVVILTVSLGVVSTEGVVLAIASQVAPVPQAEPLVQVTSVKPRRPSQSEMVSSGSPASSQTPETPEEMFERYKMNLGGSEVAE